MFQILFVRQICDSRTRKRTTLLNLCVNNYEDAILCRDKILQEFGFNNNEAYEIFNGYMGGVSINSRHSSMFDFNININEIKATKNIDQAIRDCKQTLIEEHTYHEINRLRTLFRNVDPEVFNKMIEKKFGKEWI